VTAKPARLIAWLCFVLTLVFIPLSVWMLTRALRTPLTTQDVWTIAGSFAGAVAFSAVGALILGRHPRHAIGWIFAFSGLATSFALVCVGYGELADSGWPLPAGDFVSRVAYVLLQSGVFLPLTLGLLLCPEGRLISRRWWPAAVAAVLGLTLRLVADTIDPTGKNPVTDGIDTAGVLITVASAGAGLAALTVRWRSASSILRRELKWMTAAATLVVLVFVADIAANLLNSQLIKPFEFLVFITAYTVIPFAAGASILRYGLYEIDFIINRAIVYIAMTAILAGLYAGFTATLQKVFLALTGQSSDATIIITVALIATLFTPVRNALQRLVDSRFKDAKDLERVLSSLEEEVGAVVDVIYGPGLAQRLARTAREGAGATGEAIFLDGAGDGAPYSQRERDRLQEAADLVALGLTLGREHAADLVAR
jgi:hypothetical protein